MPNKNTISSSYVSVPKIIKGHKNSYFAARNCASGFVSDFDDVFFHCKRIIIIKGGPGTGKSTLMKAFASEAENRNLPIEYFYCSSDTSSLDGVIIGNNDLALIDGTAPHTSDPKLPGVRDEIVNLGEFWNPSALKKDEKEIKHYVSTKTALYKRVYRLMAVSEKASSLCREIALSHCDMSKMDAALGRIARSFKSDGTVVRSRGISAFGVQGYVRFDSYEKNAEEIYGIRDKFGISHIFLKMLAKKAQEIGSSIDLSNAPVSGELDAFLVHSTGSAFLLHTESADKYINLERFTYKSISLDRSDIKKLRAISDEALLLASEKLSEIGELHEKLEQIYINAMDFRALGDHTKKLLVSVFKNQLY